MQVKLKRIAPLQAGKMLGVLYAAFSLLFVPFLMIFFALGSVATRSQTGPMPPGVGIFFGLGALGLVCVPVFYGLMGFVFGALGAGLYNLMARWLGGLDLAFETPPSVPPAPPPL